MLPPLPLAAPPWVAQADLTATLGADAHVLEGELRWRLAARPGAVVRELVVALPANQGDPEGERLAFPQPERPWGTYLESMAWDGLPLPCSPHHRAWAWRVPLPAAMRPGTSHELRLRFRTELGPGPRPTARWRDGGVGLLGAHPVLLSPLPGGQGWPRAPQGAWAPAAPACPMPWTARLSLPPGWVAVGPGRREGGVWTLRHQVGVPWVVGPGWVTGELAASGSAPALQWMVPPSLAAIGAQFAAMSQQGAEHLARAMGPGPEDGIVLAVGEASPWGLATGPGWAIAPEGALALRAHGGPDPGLRWLGLRGLAGAWWPSSILNRRGEVVGWGPALGAWAAAWAWGQGEGVSWGWPEVEARLDPSLKGQLARFRLSPAQAQQVEAWRWRVFGLEGGLDSSLSQLGPGAAMALVEAWGPARLEAWAAAHGETRPALASHIGAHLRQGPLLEESLGRALPDLDAQASGAWRPRGPALGWGPWTGTPWPPSLGMSPGTVATGLGRDMTRGFWSGWQDGKPIGGFSAGFRMPGSDTRRIQAVVASRPEGLALAGTLVGAWRSRWGSATAWRPYGGVARRPIDPQRAVWSANGGLQWDEGAELVDLRPARRMARFELEVGQGLAGPEVGGWLEGQRTWAWGGSGAFALRSVVAGRWGALPGDGYRLDREAGFRRADPDVASRMVALQGELLGPQGDALGLPRGLGWVVPQGLLHGGLGWTSALHAEAGLGLRMSLLGWGSPLSVQVEWSPLATSGWSWASWNTRLGHAW